MHRVTLFALLLISAAAQAQTANLGAAFSAGQQDARDCVLKDQYRTLDDCLKHDRDAFLKAVASGAFQLPEPVVEAVYPTSATVSVVSIHDDQGHCKVYKNASDIEGEIVPCPDENAAVKAQSGGTPPQYSDYDLRQKIDALEKQVANLQDQIGKQIEIDENLDGLIGVLQQEITSNPHLPNDQDFNAAAKDSYAAYECGGWRIWALSSPGDDCTLADQQ